MADFRKWFPVLVVTLLLGVMTASAQVTPALTCSTNAGVPPILRAEGLTELAGDLVMNCTGGDPNQPFLANVQIFANTNITSKLLSTSALSGYTEALLLLNEPKKGTVNPMPVTAAGTYDARKAYNAFRGQKVSSSAVAWMGVPIAPPGTNPNSYLVIRATNIRVDATTLLPAGSVGGSLLPQQLIVYVSISGSTSVPVNNPQQVLGYVQQGLTFSPTNCNNSEDGRFASFRQCSSQQGDLFNVTKTSFVNGGLRFTENFPTAFKDASAPAGGESYAGQVMGNSESGFQSVSLGGETGVPNSATRLIAKFTNVPAGVQVFVGLNNTAFSKSISGVATSIGGTVGTTVALISGSDVYGNGGKDATALTGVSAFSTRGPGCSSSGDSEVKLEGTAAIGIAEVVLDATGSGMAVWEVRTTTPNAIETVWIPVFVKYSSNLNAGTPGLGTASAYGLLGPAYPNTVVGYNQSTVDYVAGGLAYPRFLDVPPASRPAAFRTVSCQTNLLFPFVTNQAGFDTGVALVNTSKDYIDSKNANEGTCEINYYGKLADGSALSKSKETSGVVAAGAYLAFSVSGASNDPKVSGNPGFQGYLIVKCNFLYAHGYAFVSDYGAQKLAHGYLALILDGSRGLSSTEALNN